MSQLGSEIKDWVISIVVAVALAMFIRTFIVELYLVDGPSMMPTLEHQQRLVVNKFIYRVRPPEKGEILIFQYPKDKSRDFIKRVIAVPGDTIEIKDHNVYVNGELQNEDYILSKCRSDYPKTTIPEGHVFVMGDNRNNSEDSRSAEIGVVTSDMIEGRAWFVLSPAEHRRFL